MKVVSLAAARAMRTIETENTNEERLSAYLTTMEDAENMTPPRPTKEKDEKKSNIIGIRFTPPELERLDRLVAAMGAAVSLDMTRAGAMRAALTEGFTVLEERFGIAKPKKTKGK